MQQLWSPSTPGGAFRQGEVLKGVVELRFNEKGLSAEALTRDDPPAKRVSHPLTVVLSPDCDLDWDFKARAKRVATGADETLTGLDPKEMGYILLCDLEEARSLEKTPRAPSRKAWEFIEANRDIRFHRIRSVQIEGLPAPVDLYIDFKRVFGLPPEYLYGLELIRVLTRHGFLMPPHAQHLADRFSYFIGRVGLPDE